MSHQCPAQTAVFSAAPSQPWLACNIKVHLWTMLGRAPLAWPITPMKGHCRWFQLWFQSAEASNVSWNSPLPHFEGICTLVCTLFSSSQELAEVKRVGQDHAHHSYWRPFLQAAGCLSTLLELHINLLSCHFPEFSSGCLGKTELHSFIPSLVSLNFPTYHLWPVPLIHLELTESSWASHPLLSQSHASRCEWRTAWPLPSAMTLPALNLHFTLSSLASQACSS